MREGGTKTLQKENHYNLSMVEGVESHPHANRIRQDLKDWHANPTTLNLEWSHSGEWARVPIQQNQTGGPEYHSYNVGRIERYVDTNGVMRRAMAYGDDSEKLLVWYNVEDMLGKMEWRGSKRKCSKR